MASHAGAPSSHPLPRDVAVPPPPSRRWSSLGPSRCRDCARASAMGNATCRCACRCSERRLLTGALVSVSGPTFQRDCPELAPAHRSVDMRRCGPPGCLRGSCMDAASRTREGSRPLAEPPSADVGHESFRDDCRVRAGYRCWPSPARPRTIDGSLRSDPARRTWEQRAEPDDRSRGGCARRIEMRVLQGSNESSIALMRP